MGIVLFLGVVPYQEKQNPIASSSSSSHFGLHDPSLQSYDNSFGDSNSNRTFGSDWYPEDATKQQQQQREEGYIQRYLCPKCGNSYKYLGDMKKHMRFQCGQEPKFECPYCHKRTKVSSNMYAHVRTMHSDHPIYIIDLRESSTLQWDDGRSGWLDVISFQYRKTLFLMIKINVMHIVIYCDSHVFIFFYFSVVYKFLL